MIFWFVLILMSLIAAISQSSVSLAWLPPTEAEELHTWRPCYGSLCYGRKDLVRFVFCVNINNFYVYAFYHNIGNDGASYDYFLDSMAPVKSVDDKAVFLFVSDDNAHH